MTSGAPIDSSGEALAVLHTRLDGHFRALRDSRDERAIGTPIFALEHGLTDAEVALMKVAVCVAVRIIVRCSAMTAMCRRADPYSYGPTFMSTSPSKLFSPSSMRYTRVKKRLRSSVSISSATR